MIVICDTLEPSRLNVDESNTHVYRSNLYFLLFGRISFCKLLYFHYSRINNDLSIVTHKGSHQLFGSLAFSIAILQPIGALFRYLLLSLF